MVRLCKVRDVLHRVNSADRAGDAQPGMQLEIQAWWRLS